MELKKDSATQQVGDLRLDSQCRAPFWWTPCVLLGWMKHPELWTGGKGGI